MSHENISNEKNELARFNMIEQQIRTWEVLDGVVLDLLKQVPREDFVPAEYKGLAFADLEIPIGENQVMLSPKVEGRILQALNPSKNETVLEIGTGSGYLTALLATVTNRVLSLEIFPKLSELAKQKFNKFPFKNIELKVADGIHGDEAMGPFDIIVYTGSLPLLPSSVEKQLKIGGRMFIVIGEAPVMQAILIKRISEDSFKRDVLFETCIPMLVNAPQPERFKF